MHVNRISATDVNMKLQLKKFDISTIAYDQVVVMIGKRCTGKSFLVKDLLYYHKDIPIGTVISATESANEFYSKIVPNLFIHDEYMPQTIDNVLKRQKLIMNKINQERSVRGTSRIDPRAFLILDDCLFDSSWTKDKNIRSLFMNGRHYKIMFIITMQYPLGIPPNLRTNIDYVFILREQLINNRRRIYENFAGMFPNFEIFCQVMDQCTENFECLVIHNNAKSNKIEDQVFWYKAEPHEEFKIGAKEFWDKHQECYNDSYDNNQDEIFSVAGLKQKKGPFVTIEKVHDM
jgi:hypothetical protein